MTIYKKTCPHCGITYETERRKQRHCSLACARRSNRRKRPEKVMSYARPLKSYASDVQRAIGQRVAEARVAKRMDQPALAAMADVCIATVQRIEHGSRGYSIQSLVPVMDALGLRVEIKEA